MELIAYKFVGYPDEEQQIRINKTFGCVRYLWNRMLSDHNVLYKQIGKVPNNTPADYKDLEECIWLNEIDSLALANVQLNLDKSFRNFFSGKTRHPRFKSKKHKEIPIPQTMLITTSNSRYPENVAY